MPQSIIAKLEEWIRNEAQAAPGESGILYIEYDGSCEGEVSLCMFGYPSIQEFDSEDPDDRGKLSDWSWESTQFVLPSSNEIVAEALEKIRDRNHNWASERRIYFAEHEANIIPLFSQLKIGSKDFFYELHTASNAGEIGSYRVGEVDEEPLVDHMKLNQNLDRCDYALIVERRPKLTDLLSFYRGWLVCTARVVELVSKFTDQLQVFDARVYRDEAETEPVDGYHVLNLYEKVDCIAKPYLLPPKWDDAPTTFDPYTGYRLDPAAVEGKDIFRLNHEYFRLVVSQQFRDQWDELELTGASWLKRRTQG